MIDEIIKHKTRISIIILVFNKLVRFNKGYISFLAKDKEHSNVVCEEFRLINDLCKQ
jgi:hypothetical protein